MTPSDPFIEMRKLLLQKANEIRASYQNFKEQIGNSPSELTQSIEQVFNKHVSTIDFLLRYLERITYSQAGLKSQIDTLKDIFVQLPEVKQNIEIQNEIDKKFRQYDAFFFNPPQ